MLNEIFLQSNVFNSRINETKTYTLKVFKFEDVDSNSSVTVKVPYLNSALDFKVFMWLVEKNQNFGKRFTYSFREMMSEVGYNLKSYDDKNTAAIRKTFEKLGLINIFSEDKDAFETEHGFHFLAKSGNELHVCFSDYFSEILKQEKFLTFFDKKAYLELETIYAKSLFLLIAGSKNNEFTTQIMIERLGLESYEPTKQRQLLNKAVSELKQKSIISIASQTLNSEGRVDKIKFNMIDRYLESVPVSQTNSKKSEAVDEFQIEDSSIFNKAHVVDVNNELHEMHADSSFSEEWLPMVAVMPDCKVSSRCDTEHSIERNESQNDTSSKSLEIKNESLFNSSVSKKNFKIF